GLTEIFLLTGMAFSRASSLPQFDRIPTVGASLLAKAAASQAIFSQEKTAVPHQPERRFSNPSTTIRRRYVDTCQI
ncbi:hypothetical protein, partial [Pseudomonas moraviensis]